MARQKNSSIQVSVVVTVLNEAQTIESLLTALLKQTYQPHEVLIVDGGSNDATVQLISKFAEHHPTWPLKVLVKKGNRSVGRNWGIQQTQSEWIAITDAGCRPKTDWLESLVQVINPTEKKAQVIAGYYAAEPKTAFETAVVPYVLVMPDRVNPNHFLPATRSVLLERKAWQIVGGFDEKLPDNEDYAFARRLLQFPHQIALSFTSKAVVIWQPRSSLLSFWWMIFRFARGDIQAGILRPKVIAIFIRYLLLIAISVGLVYYRYWLWFGLLAVTCLVVYGSWAVAKNYRYAKNGWWWLPVLQHAADSAVMLGSVLGAIGRVTQPVSH